MGFFLPMNKLKYYIQSFRLRTLPLSMSGILAGSLLAMRTGSFSSSIFLLSLLTTLCLQILSNLANELGDAQKGTDNADRVGPARSLQTGRLTEKDFKKAILLFVILSLVSGISLVFRSFHSLLDTGSLLLLISGGAAIGAAIKYTMGKNPYGYRGWGDIFVFLFFGCLSTSGSYYLMTHSLNAGLLLPASAIGLLSTGVLNVNNIRDIENDRRCGKYTIPVKTGEKKAKIYHTCLIIGAQFCALAFAGISFHGLRSFLPLFTLPLFFLHLHNMWLHSGKDLDPQLRFLSLTTFVFAILLGIS